MARDAEQWKTHSSQQEADIQRLSKDRDAVSAKCNAMQDLVAAKSSECAVATREVQKLGEDLNLSKQAQLALATKVSRLSGQLADAAAAQKRMEAEKRVLEAETTATKSDLNAAHSQIESIRGQLTRKTMHIRELNHMLEAWEAMRVGKDAQIAALMERCLRLEEENKSSQALEEKGVNGEQGIEGVRGSFLNLHLHSPGGLGS